MSRIDEVNGRRAAFEKLAAQNAAADALSLLGVRSRAIKDVTISEASVRVTIDTNAPPLDHPAIWRVNDDDIPEDIVIERPVRLARRGVGRKLILDDARTQPDQTMIDLIVMARRWRAEIFENGAALKASPNATASIRATRAGFCLSLSSRPTSRSPFLRDASPSLSRRSD